MLVGSVRLSSSGNILRWPVIVLLLILAMALVYYFAPDVEQKRKWITPGSVFAVIVTIVASLVLRTANKGSKAGNNVQTVGDFDPSFLVWCT